MSLLKALGGAGASASAKLYVEDCFSTFLYTGNGSTQTINNGIDLAGQGGMVWSKSRNVANGHHLIDSERGAGNSIYSNSTIAEEYYNNTLTSFNADGFTLGDAVGVNGAYNFASWTFRKAPKFFDIVTYTGNGVAGRQIPHNLGCEVGMMIVKDINNAQHWAVYHRSQGYLYKGRLNTSDPFYSTTTHWGSTPPSDSTFSLGDNLETNKDATEYIAYLYAHDTSADGIIQCGSFTTDGSGKATVNLGWEPQYLIGKGSNVTTNWIVFDVMRGLTTGTTNDARLIPNSSDVEDASDNYDVTATGFICKNLPTSSNYIYMAIRRPMKVPTSGTEVFAINTASGSTLPTYKSGFPVDMAFSRAKTTTNNWLNYSRLAGSAYMYLNATDAEASNSLFKSDYMNGIRNSTTVDVNDYGWMFKRAKGFFDVVCYTGTGVARTVNHNLGVVPELMIVKSRSSAQDWMVYHKDVGNRKYSFLNSTAIPDTWTLAWNDTTPDSSLFTLGSGTPTNGSGLTFVAYLFATLAGISKVGSYTGNGTSQTINCGFTTGARFVLIKRTNSTGDWYIWDTVRGIVAANDPHLSLNTTAAEVTTDDSIDPEASGFIVNQVAATNINVTSATYIFLAIS